MRLQTMHSGGCCGVQHLFGFNSPFSMQHTPGGRYQRQSTFFKNQMKVFNAEGNDTYGRDGGTRGKLIEVILTDGQVESYSGWIPLLKENGFRLVSRFNNSTGGWCNVFHLTTQRSGDESIPSWWLDADYGKKKAKEATNNE